MNKVLHKKLAIILLLICLTVLIYIFRIAKKTAHDEVKVSENIVTAEEKCSDENEDFELDMLYDENEMLDPDIKEVDVCINSSSSDFTYTVEAENGEIGKKFGNHFIYKKPVLYSYDMFTLTAIDNITHQRLKIVQRIDIDLNM